MKYLTRTLISAAILFVASNASARSSDDVDCPPIPTVSAHAKFVKAERGYDNIWGMISSPFDYKGINWTILFAARLSQARSAAEAISAGQTYFQNNVTLTEPVPTSEQGISVCLYGYNSNHLVATVNVPFFSGGTQALVNLLMK